jgi:hypothetical protein
MKILKEIVWGISWNIISLIALLEIPIFKRDENFMLLIGNKDKLYKSFME